MRVSNTGELLGAPKYIVATELLLIGSGVSDVLPESIWILPLQIDYRVSDSKWIPLSGMTFYIYRLTTVSQTVSGFPYQG